MNWCTQTRSLGQSRELMRGGQDRPRSCQESRQMAIKRVGSSAKGRTVQEDRSVSFIVTKRHCREGSQAPPALAHVLEPKQIPILVRFDSGHSPQRPQHFPQVPPRVSPAHLPRRRVASPSSRQALLARSPQSLLTSGLALPGVGLR